MGFWSRKKPKSETGSQDAPEVALDSPPAAAASDHRGEPEPPTSAEQSPVAEPGRPSPEARPPDEAARAFGEITALLARDEAYRARPISDLLWMVGPAIAARQLMVAHARGASGPAPDGAPVGFLIWASVSDEIDASLKASGGRLDALKLHAKGWRSGKNLWIAALAGPENVKNSLVSRLEQRVGAGTPIYLLKS